MLRPIFTFWAYIPQGTDTTDSPRRERRTYEDKEGPPRTKKGLQRTGTLTEFIFTFWACMPQGTDKTDNPRRRASQGLSQGLSRRASKDRADHCLNIPNLAKS